MNVSTKYTYRILKDKLIIKNIKNKKKYILNETGQKIFYFLKDNTNIRRTYEKYINYYQLEYIDKKIIKNNFLNCITFLRSINIFNELCHCCPVAQRTETRNL